MEQFKVSERKPLEKDIEAYGCGLCRKEGWVSEKYTSPAKRSVPDRIVFKPGGDIFFVEYKRPGAKATKLQVKDHDRRKAMGFRVYVVDTYDEARRVVEIESKL
jgi:hypothetical protein